MDNNSRCKLQLRFHCDKEVYMVESSFKNEICLQMLGHILNLTLFTKEQFGFEEKYSNRFPQAVYFVVRRRQPIIRNGWEAVFHRRCKIMIAIRPY